MRCYICNAILLPEEINYSRDHDKWDPCRRCLAEISEVFEPLSEEELDVVFEQLDIGDVLGEENLDESIP